MDVSGAEATGQTFFNHGGREEHIRTLPLICSGRPLTGRQFDFGRSLRVDCTVKPSQRGVLWNEMCFFSNLCEPIIRHFGVICVPNAVLIIYEPQ